MSAHPLRSLKTRIPPLSCALHCGAMGFEDLWGFGVSLASRCRGGARSPP